MDISQYLMVAIFIVTLLALVKFQQNPERVFAFATLVCLALSYISTEQLLASVTNTGLVTLIVLVICSFAIERTSFLRKVSAFLINGSVPKSYFKTLVSTALASGFMNNTAVVATMLSPIKCNTLINPSRLLLPLSYAAILGGTLTLVGTSTNLIVNTMLIEQGNPGLAFFDFTLVGATALIVCLIVIFLTVRHLPRTALEKDLNKEYFLEAEVAKDSLLIGKTIEENGLRNLDALFLVEVIKGEQLISPVAPDYRIASGDKLIFTGDISKVLVLKQFDGLELFALQDGLLRENLTEVLIKPDSAVVGKTLKSSGFRARFDAAVVAIRREGERLSGKLGDICIQSGDFLVLAVGNDFKTRTNLSKNFFILSGVQPENMLTGWRDKSVLVGFGIAILSSVIFSFSLLKCLIFYLAFLVATNCLSINEVKRRFPIEIFTIVVGALSLAKAMENTGLANVISDMVSHSLEGQTIYMALIGVYLVTLLVTETITNNAAAALVFPIAYNIALGLGVSPLPFVMAVAFAASGSFISPYGYQTNVMVYNAGNYRLMDFVRFGLPVSIAYGLVVLYMLPKVFPF
jgi:di/tricarboxylate transporter